MKPADAKLMKELNKMILRRIFKANIEVTAGQLSKQSGLSTVTVNALLKEMKGHQEIFEMETIPSNGGRPSRLYRYNERLRCAAIIYGFQKNNEDHITLIVTDLLGNPIFRKEKVFECIIETTFDELLDVAFEAYPMIELICFGLPGSEEQGVITLCDYPMLIGNTFMDYYQRRYETPVLFINDINAAVNGYYHEELNADISGTVIGIFFPRRYFPGAGAIINGEIYKGSHNFAGELGCLPLGIDWLAIDYENSELVSDVVSKLLAMISCILAPKQFILYGDFWNSNSASHVKAKTEIMLNHKFEIQVLVSNDFEEHYEQGMINAALEQLEADVQKFDTSKI